MASQELLQSKQMAMESICSLKQIRGGHKANQDQSDPLFIYTVLSIRLF